jgi:hypothetical protein
VAIQLPALHWFYLYIPWFMPVVLIAVLTAGEEPHEGQVAVADRPEDALFEHEDQPAAVAVAA